MAKTQTQKAYEAVKELFINYGATLDQRVGAMSPRRKYLFEVLKTLPLPLLLHQWILVSPYSEYRVLELLMMIVRYGVSLLIASFWVLNPGVALLGYVLCMGNIAVSWFKVMDYWTVQNEAYDQCHEKNTLIWTDLFAWWKLPFIITSVMQAVYLCFKLEWFCHFLKETCPKQAYWLALGTAVPDIISMQGIFPVFFSELSYWIKSGLMIGVVFLDIIVLGEMDEAADKLRLQHLVAKLKNTDNLSKKALVLNEIHTLDRKIKLRKEGRNTANRLPGRWFVRDTLIACAIPYVVFAISYEMLVNKRPFLSFVTLPVIIEVSASWCTTSAAALVFSALFGTLSNLCVTFSFFFLSTEFNLHEIFDANIGGHVQIVALISILETNLLSLDYTEKNDAMETACFFSLFAIFLQSFNVLEQKVFHAVNSGTSPGMTFRIKVGLLTGIMCLGPCIVTYNVARTLSVNSWTLFLASGNFHLAVALMFMITESILILLAWRATDDISKLEDALYFCRRTKSVIFFTGTVIQLYCRFTCGLFKTWWIFRLGFTLAELIGATIVFYNIEKARSEARNKMKFLMNSLVTITYSATKLTKHETATEEGDNEDYEDNEDDDADSHRCAICFAEMSEGKMLPCAHVFHTDCIRKWFQIKFVCPFCNTQVLQ